MPVVTLRIGTWDHHGNVFRHGGNIFTACARSCRCWTVDHGARHRPARPRFGQRSAGAGLGRVRPHAARFNKVEGRDHWPDAGFALFAGGGCAPARSSAKPTAEAERPRTRRSVRRTCWRRSTMRSASICRETAGLQRPAHAAARRRRTDQRVVLTVADCDKELGVFRRPNLRSRRLWRPFATSLLLLSSFIILADSPLLSGTLCSQKCFYTIELFYAAAFPPDPTIVDAGESPVLYGDALLTCIRCVSICCFVRKPLCPSHPR